MILANLRERLTPADVQLVVQVLSQGDAGCRDRLSRLAEERGIDNLLDEPELFDLLTGAPELGSPSPALFLCVAVRNTLRRAGVDDGRLSDYLGALLLEFGLRERAYRIARHDDEVYEYVADIVADIGTVSGRRKFLLQVHLGNFTLWLAGVFPDYITARTHRRGGPDLSYYEEMGTRGFRLAATNQLARDFDLADIYAQVAESFATLRVALNRLSDGLFFPNLSSADRLMRQVSDESRYSL